jgi:hypothetical protein
VYLHKTTRGFEKIFTALMERVARLVLDDSVSSTGLQENHPIVGYLRDPDRVDLFLRLDDTVIYGALSMFAGAPDPVVRELSGRLMDRKPNVCVDISKFMAAKFEMPDSADAAERRAARQKARIMTARATELVKERQLTSLKNDEQIPLILEDERAKRSAYKQEGGLSSMYLVGSDNKMHELVNLSPVVEALEEFQAYRLYARDIDVKQTILNTLAEIAP